jgi:hypothetical protein
MKVGSVILWFLHNIYADKRQMGIVNGAKTFSDPSLRTCKKLVPSLRSPE